MTAISTGGRLASTTTLYERELCEVNDSGAAGDSASSDHDSTGTVPVTRANAPGGALDYVVRGNMIGGFALVAYPAEYRNSGVMTFLVNHQGVVYEKDLGPDTARIASGMTAFNPDSTWQRVSDAAQPGAGTK